MKMIEIYPVLHKIKANDASNIFDGKNKLILQKIMRK